MKMLVPIILILWLIIELAVGRDRRDRRNRSHKL